MRAATCFFVVIALGSSLRAASPTPTPPATPTPSPTPACNAVEFRQFDFWLGQWKVLDLSGQQVGTSEITHVAEGCALREQWTAASGKGGMSLNYYDATDQKWHQDRVGGDGTILHLRGGLKENAMILIGESKGQKGTVINRITWTPLPDGKVKQEWATSTNNGAKWVTACIGLYEKSAAPSVPEMKRP